MKATSYVGRLILVGVLTVFGAGAVTAAQPETTAVKAHSGQKAPAKKRAPMVMVSKSKSAHEIAKKPLPSARLDLSLPPDMVSQLKPLGTVTRIPRKRLLPNMFGEKPETNSPFQLNGRLISNEMDLQLRNEGRDKEIEGAALEFEFKQ